MRWSFVSGALARTASEAQFDSPAFRVREPSRSRFPFCRSVPVLDDLVARGCVGRLLCSGCEVSAEWSDGVSVSSAWCLAGGASRRLLSGGFNPDLSGLACSAFFELRNLAASSLIFSGHGILSLAALLNSFATMRVRVSLGFLGSQWQHELNASSQHTGDSFYWSLVDVFNPSVFRFRRCFEELAGFVLRIDVVSLCWVRAESICTQNVVGRLGLCVAFLAFDVIFVVLCVAVACLVGIAVCCCLPCIIAVLYALADREGASDEEIERLPKFKFLTLKNSEKVNGEIRETHGGIMTQLGVDSPSERVLSSDEAECCICLCDYEDGTELRELSCRHHFHEACIDKWLRINATCPLCKFNILKTGEQSCNDAV
ncbi:hypothetical protein DY000_02028812 [Brassica cretica]|uniref:RING-type E3 ubiquitin transferase n=1 Tax=Brassica cretica TaxID=69181 RepID=A0ABQ7DVC9_BRACR|nr:hypothetical protein DY000_02028812 [Brassica cretica]